MSFTLSITKVYIQFNAKIINWWFEFTCSTIPNYRGMVAVPYQTTMVWELYHTKLPWYGSHTIPNYNGMVALPYKTTVVWQGIRYIFYRCTTPNYTGTA